MTIFETNIAGRVSNTHLSSANSLMPLYEAIANSIEAMNEENIEYGKIEIKAERKAYEQINFEGKTELSEFSSFTVIDNGEGFNDDNYTSFKTADSRLKAYRGCKGIGRFLWLKAFENVNIVSNYKNDDKYYTRQLDFNLQGITNEKNEEINDSSPKTRITLSGFKNEYSKSVTKELKKLAENIIGHFLIYFVTGKCPMMKLCDNKGEEYSLNSLYNEEMKNRLEKNEIRISQSNFTLYHICLGYSVSAHKLHLCASNREVKSIDLKKYIPNLQRKIKRNDGSEFWYTGYLTGEYLNSIVNTERSNFFFPNDELGIGDTITENNVIDASIQNIRTFLSSDLNNIDEIKRKEIDDFIERFQPKYKILRKYIDDFYDRVPADLSSDKLEMELHKIEYEWSVKLNEETRKFLYSDKSMQNIDEFKQLYHTYLKQINALGKLSLTEYIVRRKAVLDLLDKSLSLNNEGKYNLEENIHTIICPMRYTSDELDYEDMNLWLIDERLSYHYFLGSDKPLSSLPPIDVASRKEPDIIIFNKPFAFVENEKPYQSISVIEFKRPMRGHYNNEDEDPIDQVIEYVNIIRGGTAKDKNGRPLGGINLSTMPIYCYIICDITEKVHKYAKRYQLNATPDGEGYYGYDKYSNSYVEIISYNKLIADAKSRNKVLFEKLFKPDLINIKNAYEEMQEN